MVHDLVLTFQALSSIRAPRFSQTLLQESAALLKSWLPTDAATVRYLREHNDIDLVLLLAGDGPKYVLKEQTKNAKRLHKKIYYDHTFANLLFPLMLQKAGKVEPVFLAITQHFVANGCACALLGTSSRLTRKRLMEDVLELEPVRGLRQQFIHKCTAAGEWKILSHDATFKSMFSIIGQEKMAQKQGEQHALHSVLGMTGALAGLSMQQTEGPKCFQQACEDILPLEARNTTLWVFTDTPDTVNLAKSCFANLQGVAEDPLHLVLRVEACFGEKRTQLSSELLRIQKKFHVAAEGPIYNGQGPQPHDEEGRWNANRQNVLHDERDWEKYTQEPYTHHQAYIDDILDLTLKFSDQMRRKNSKGQTVRQILLHGASFHHFGFLQNGCHLRATLTPQQQALLGLGTAANEALHSEFNATQRQVIQQHLDAMTIVLRSFVFNKLAAHNSAAYSPTTAQRSQAQIQSLMAGEMARSFFLPFNDGAFVPVTNRQRVRQPVHQFNSAQARAFKALRALQAQAWTKHVRRIRCRAKHVLKRTVFTKAKQRRPRKAKRNA